MNNNLQEISDLQDVKKVWETPALNELGTDETLATVAAGGDGGSLVT